MPTFLTKLLLLVKSFEGSIGQRLKNNTLSKKNNNKLTDLVHALSGIGNSSGHVNSWFQIGRNGRLVGIPLT